MLVSYKERTVVLVPYGYFLYFLFEWIDLSYFGESRNIVRNACLRPILDADYLVYQSYHWGKIYCLDKFNPIPSKMCLLPGSPELVIGFCRTYANPPIYLMAFL